MQAVQNSPGKFIVFEGGEGVGKTTQLHRLQHWLVNHPRVQQLQSQGAIAQVQVTREPGGSELGQSIRQLLLENHAEPVTDRTELLLYAADRAHHVAQYLHPALDQGNLVLCDRYTDSTVAYQGYGRGIDLALIDQLNQIATAGLVSDLTLWLDAPLAISRERMTQRGNRDRMEQASLDFHQRVHDGFAALAQAHPQRIVRIDASGDPDTVATAIQDCLTQHLHQWYPDLSSL